MKKLIVKSGKNELVLKKSKSLVGIKPVSKEVKAKAIGAKAEVLSHLGGFKVVTLDKGKKSVDKKLDEVRKKKEVDIGTHVYHVEGSKRPLVPTGEIYIIFQEECSAEEKQIVLDEYHLELVETRDNNTIIAKVTVNSPNPLKVAHYLSKISMVKVAEPDLDTLLDEYAVTVGDPLLKHAWHLRNAGFVPDIDYRLKRDADAKVVDAWNRMGNTGSNQVVVAVIDNGFDLTHPDLSSKIFKPYDLWNQSGTIIQGDPRFTHGTPCASVAVASADGSGMVGSAPNAKFMPISGTSFSIRATEEMFEKAANNGADIISCSWGTTDPNFAPGPIKEAAIAKAAREGRNGKGCVILYAAGNDDLDYLSYYATHPDVIAVGASTSQDEHANYSNRGRELTVVAPSNGDWPILAARANWDEGTSLRGPGAFRYWADGKSRGDNYKHFGGTSSSTPLVAGICALMLSENPDLTAKQVKQILIKTADKIGSPSEYVNGHSVKYGYGRVNADKAVAEAIRLRDAKNNPKPVVEENVASGQGLFKFTVERQPSEGYGVQIGVFKEYGNVLIAAEKLQTKFNSPTVVNINELAGETVYKVLIGPFATKSEA
ncbi:MAG: S8 family serine peptidase, partial [Bacteroidota bacterium]